MKKSFCFIIYEYDFQVKSGGAEWLNTKPGRNFPREHLKSTELLKSHAETIRLDYRKDMRDMFIICDKRTFNRKQNT